MKSDLRIMSLSTVSIWCSFHRCILVPLFPFSQFPPLLFYCAVVSCLAFSVDPSQSTAEILLLSVSENKRPSCWNSTSGFDFHVCVTIGMSFCIWLPIFSKSDHPRHIYDVRSISKDGGGQRASVWYRKVCHQAQSMDEPISVQLTQHVGLYESHCFRDAVRRLC